MNPSQSRLIRISLLTLVLLTASLVSATSVAQASTFLNFVSQTPMNPTNTQTVTVIFNSDTAFGETVRIVFTTATAPNTPPDPVPATGAGSACTFVAPSGPGFNWSCSLPAEPKDTVLKYTGFVTNQPSMGSMYYGLHDGPIQYEVTGPNAASYSRKSVSRAHGVTTVRWYSSLRVIGFDVYDGHRRLNKRIVTSRTFWYRFTTRHVIRHPRIFAVWPASNT